jgi:hypothetical protein
MMKSIGKNSMFSMSFLVLGWLCSIPNRPGTNGLMAVNSVPGDTSRLSKKERKSLDSLEIDFQFRGSCYAYSSPANAIASNGEAHSDNLPKKAGEGFNGSDLYLAINEKELCKHRDKYLGHKLYLVNKSGAKVEFRAQDSRLSIYAEAQDSSGAWKPISYLPSSWCGNSYHKIVLDKDEYWEFDVPVFKGSFLTKMRYVLDMGEKGKIISNDIAVRLNKGQLDPARKQGHMPEGIMDPYDE